MMKKGLGKGLDAIFNMPEQETVKEAGKKQTTGENEKETVYDIKINKIEPNRNQPRKSFEEDKITELSESIKLYGIIQPIIVTKKDDYYEIVAGERRWRAAKLAGLKTIPAIIREDKKGNNKKIALIENIQRQDLNSIEQALAIKGLMEEYNLKQEEIAASLGKSRSTVANIIRLLNLDERVQQLVLENKLTEGHCKVLLTQSSKDKQYALAMQIIKEGVTVRDLEKKVKGTNKTKKKEAFKNNVFLRDIAKNLETYFGTKASIVPKNKESGKIVIEYFSTDDLDRILEKLN